MASKKEITEEQTQNLFKTLKARFEKYPERHKNIDWTKIQIKLESNPEKLWALNQMEITEGEPDVIGYDKKNDEYIFFDCSAESPKGRRSLCYDKEALESRKEHKPENNALDMVAYMGINILNEDDYRNLQQMGKFDLKTSSWLETPEKIRKLGGAIFGDCRYEHVFIYHNGAESYYAARGFRGKLIV